MFFMCFTLFDRVLNTHLCMKNSYLSYYISNSKSQDFTYAAIYSKYCLLTAIFDYVGYIKNLQKLVFPLKIVAFQ